MKRDKRVTWHPTDISHLHIKDKNIVIIGGTGGIGRALSVNLASLGAKITVVGQTFRDGNNSNIKFIKADLSLMSEAKRIASEINPEKIDMLIFTTGIFAAPQRQETAEGIERDLAVSYLNRFVILQELASKLGSQQQNSKIKPRIFIMAYPGSGQIGSPEDLNADKSYKAMAVHMNTVAGNEILVLDSARKYMNATFYGLNPGLIKTNIRDNFFGKDSLKSRLIETIIGWFTPHADDYAKRILPLLFSEDIEKYSGALFNNKGHAIQPSAGLSGAYIRKFVSASQNLLKLKGIQVRI